MLIQKGVNLSNPPNKVPPLNNDPDCHLNYRQAPFIIQAAVAGDVKVMKTLVKAGCQLNDVGHICLSKRRQNSVASNVIGACAYHGQDKALKYCLQELQSDFVNVQAIETADREAKKGGVFKPEMNEFTPLQLALISPHPNISIVK